MKSDKTQRYIYGETFSTEAPRPTPVAYEILSRHLTQSGGDKNETHDILNDLYKALGENEQAAETALDKLEQAGAISREDTLVLVVLLAVSRTQGSNLNFLRQAIISRSYNFEELNTQILRSGLNKIIIGYLQSLISNLKKVGVS